MAGMIADIGERAIRIRRSRLPGKFVVATAMVLGLLASSIVFENTSSRAAEAPTSYGWQATTVLLPQTLLNIDTSGKNITATYHFGWNESYDLSKLNWSVPDRTRTDQLYVLGLGAKVWVQRVDIDADFPVEFTQGDGTSLNYRFDYTTDRETRHMYLTGERSFWKWDRTPNVIYNYSVKGSCSIEDAWKAGGWTPEEGIALKFAPEGTLVLGRCDFEVRVFVYGVMVPEFGSLAPIVGLAAIAVIVLERKRRICE